MRRKLTEEKLTYDFEAGAWVAPDKLSAIYPQGGSLEQDSVPSEGSWGPPVVDPDEQMRARLQKVATWLQMLGSPLAFVLLAGQVKIHSPNPWLWYLAAGSFMALILGCALGVFTSLTSNALKLRRRDLELLEDPEDLQVCLVALDVVFGGKVVGSDRGAAYFEGGALRFVGARTSFTIGGQDVVPRGERNIVPEEFHHDDRVTMVPLLPAHHKTWVRLRPINRPDAVGKESASNFRENVRDFRDRRKKTSLPRQYPPLGEDR